MTELLEYLRQRTLVAECLITDPQRFQNGWADAGHTDAVQIHAALDVRSPGDEGSFQSFTKGQEAVRTSRHVQFIHQFAARAAREGSTLCGFEGHLCCGFCTQIAQEQADLTNPRSSPARQAA